MRRIVRMPAVAAAAVQFLLSRHAPEAPAASAAPVAGKPGARSAGSAMTVTAAHGGSALSARSGGAANMRRYPCPPDALTRRPTSESGYPSSTTFARSTAAAR